MMPLTPAEKQANFKARMEKAGLVRHQHVWAHPKDWPHGGYLEIQHPPERYRVIDTEQLLK